MERWPRIDAAYVWAMAWAIERSTALSRPAKVQPVIIPGKQP